MASDSSLDSVPRNEPIFDNKYSETIDSAAQTVAEQSIRGAHYQVHWNFTSKENIRITFALFSVASPVNLNRRPSRNRHRAHSLPTAATFLSRPLESIYALHYFLFTIRQYRTNTEKILEIEQLIRKNASSNNGEHFSNSLNLAHLNAKEKYSVCICYYQKNESIAMPAIHLCQDVINDYAKYVHAKTDPKYGLLFVGTQYSIILGLLVLFQTLFSMQKRRVAHILHQHLINKAHRFRTSISSISLVRHSISSVDTTPTEQHQPTNHGHHKMHRESKRNGDTQLGKAPTLASCPRGLGRSSTLPSDAIHRWGEVEPLIKATPCRNHVQFSLNLDEGLNGSIDIDLASTLSVEHVAHEPYSDGSDALRSMVHILDVDKPWSRFRQHAVVE